MKEQVLGSLRLDLELLAEVVAAVPDERMAESFPGHPNHLAWTLGHLAHSFEAMGGELGLEPWNPPSWGEAFGRGSRPVSDRAEYPSRAELLERLAEGERRLRDRIAAMGEAELAAELPDVRFRDRYPTLGHALVHVLSSHTGRHMGQLDGWLRAAGLR